MEADSQTKEETAESFERRMTDVVVSGHVMIGLAVGTKLGLFRAMTEITNQPFTAAQLAEKSNCKERYIQEWLSHMVVADIVDTVPTGDLFSFPEHRHAALTSPDQLVPAVASPFPYLLLPHRELLECFRRDGPSGLPFPKVAPVLQEYGTLPSEVGDIYFCGDFAADNIPGLREKLESGICVCDIGSGDGKMVVHLAARFPNSSFDGFELDPDQLQRSRDLATSRGVTNAEFHAQDACTTLPDRWTDRYDLVTMREVFHDLPFASKCAKELLRSLKVGGSLAVFEPAVSSNIYDVYQDPGMKMMSQILLPTSLYHCLAAAMYEQPSEALGLCAGKEKLVAIFKKAGYDIVSADSMGDNFKYMIHATKPEN